jgi:alpha-tubulin suppressor-like RCC1 family protein
MKGLVTGGATGGGVLGDSAGKRPIDWDPSYYALSRRMDTASFAPQLIRSDGTVSNWGFNSVGQLGRATSSKGYATDPNMGSPSALTDIVFVGTGLHYNGSTGWGYSYFVDAFGDVWSCGGNYYGELGRSVATGSNSSVNLGQVFALSNVVKVAALGYSACFLKSDGTVWSCGFNYHGQLGRAVASGGPSSVNLGQIPGLANVVDVVVGGQTYMGTPPPYYLFLKSDGTVWSCGANSYGQLGRAVATGSASSVNLGQIPGLTNVVDVAAGGQSSYFLLADGTVRSCGDNRSGQLGRSVASGSASSVNLGPISALTNVRRLSRVFASGDTDAGGVYFLRQDGSLWTCGANTYGQLGRVVANGGPTSVNLGAVTALSDVVDATLGPYSGYMLRADGTVWSCGYNPYGQLGRPVAPGSNSTSNLGQIPHLRDVVALYAEGVASYIAPHFLDARGTLWGCGYNDDGTMGATVASGSNSLTNLSVVLHDV